MLRRHVISIQPVLHLVLPEIYTHTNAQRSYFKMDYNQDHWRRNPFGRMSPDASGSIPPTAVSKLRQFRSPYICLYESFGRDTKSRWFLLSRVYARGSKRSHTGGKCVTCSGLTDSREQLLR